MKMKKLTTAFAMAASLAAVSSAVEARGTATGVIDKITSSGSVTNIFLSNPSVAVSGESRPACATRDDFFTLASDQKNQLAIVLTAYALAQEIKINGNGECNNKSNAEDVSSISVVAP